MKHRRAKTLGDLNFKNEDLCQLSQKSTRTMKENKYKNENLKEESRHRRTLTMTGKSQ